MKDRSPWSDEDVVKNASQSNVEKRKKKPTWKIRHDLEEELRICTVEGTEYERILVEMLDKAISENPENPFIVPFNVDKLPKDSSIRTRYSVLRKFNELGITKPVIEGNNSIVYLTKKCVEDFCNDVEILKTFSKIFEEVSIWTGLTGRLQKMDEIAQKYSRFISLSMGH